VGRRSYSGGEHIDTERDARQLASIEAREGHPAALISTKRAIEGTPPGHPADVPGLEAAGALRGLPAYGWYGNVKGSNDFGGQRVGGVIGTQHFGDGYIREWATLADESIEIGTTTGEDGRFRARSYGMWGDRVRDHMAARETLQAVLRFGRGGEGARVYVDTSALPEWVPRRRADLEAGTARQKIAGAVERAGGLAGATAGEIAAKVDVSGNRVRVVLSELVESGAVARDGATFYPP
jgi:hypothetical protein